MDPDSSTIRADAQAQADIAMKRARIYAAMRKAALLKKVLIGYENPYDDLEELGLDRDEWSVYESFENGRSLCETFEQEQDRHDNMVDKISNAEADLQVKIDQYIDELSAEFAAECRALCDGIHSALPREVRDMIYESMLNISEPETIGNTRVEYSAYTPLRMKSTTGGALLFNRIESFDDGGVLRICNTRFFGPETLRELAETYYRTRTFHMRNQTCGPLSVQHLTTFLEDRMSGLGLEVGNLVNNLVVTLQLARGALDERILSSQCMDVLLSLKKSTNIEVRTTCSLREVGELSAVVQKLSVNFPDLEKLLLAGHKVIFQIIPKVIFQIITKVVFQRTPKIKIKVKKEELTVAAWMEKLREE